MGPGMGGPHHFLVSISTNDPERPKLEFNVYANSTEENPPAYLQVRPQQLQAALPQKNFTLVNVHIPFAGRISGTDLEIPYDQIDQHLDKLPQAKDAPIVLYCQSGRMSEIAAERLAELGYTKLYNLHGGMVEWREAGFPLEDK